jgi:PAS domain S-box-containing protein
MRLGFDNVSLAHDSSKKPAAAPRGVHKAAQPKWYLLYFVLAFFDLMTVCTTLYLNHRAMIIYSDSVRVNQEWAEQLNQFAELGQLASNVNAPGNNVFDSHNVPVESAQMDAALQQFNAAVTIARAGLAKQVNPGEAAELGKQMDSVNSTMVEMVDEAKLIFQFFASNQPEKAGSRMATMDQKYELLNRALRNVSAEVRQIQKLALTDQMSMAEDLRKFEYIIAVAILFMVFGIAVYGHQLSRSMTATMKAMQASEERFRLLSAASPVGIFQTDTAGRCTYSNARWQQVSGLTAAQSLGDGWMSTVLPEDRDAVLLDWSTAARADREFSREYRLLTPLNELRWVHSRASSMHDSEGELVGHVGTVEDITERKHAQAKLEQLHKQLLETSRQAGMAEIATNVLHNVGNILNSVNVSADLVSSTLRTSRAEGLTRAVQLMDEHAADLGDFLTLDDQGKRLPDYLKLIVQALAQEQQGMIEELNRLTRCIDHIKDVVATQQSYAGGSSLIEPLQICDLAEDALRMSGEALTRHRVTVVTEFSQVPVVRLDRARVLQILVNLINNAKNAMESLVDGSRQITLRVEAIAGASLRISVKDEGEGILVENLTRIFAHGFTTRKDGHGFGLHSSALAARQMGGDLTVHSDGAGRGATFTLEIPIDTTQGQA